MYGYIYITTNLINGKQYIGKHKSSKFDKYYKGSGKILNQAFNKYGKENFECCLMEMINDIPTICNTEEELNNSEKYYIEYYKAVESETFYNLLPGGPGGGNGINSFSCQPKEKQKEIVEKRTIKPNLGKKIINNGKQELFIKINELQKYLDKGWLLGRLPFSEEHKQKMGRKGRKHTVETKDKIRKKHKGKSLSSEHKEKISKAEKGKAKNISTEGRKKISENTKKVSLNTYLIKKDGIVKRIPKEEFEIWKNLGWVRGRYAYDNSWLQNMRQDRSQRVHIHKDGERKMILKTELTSYLEQGWKTGRK